MCERVATRNLLDMTEFHFSNGARKCIRPILEAYQSGKG